VASNGYLLANGRNHGVHHLPRASAQEIDRATAWYKEKLGLDPVLHGNERVEPGTRVFEYDLLYDTGTARFGVYESPHAGRNRATAARIVVADFDAAVAELRANGVVFEDYDLGDDFRTIDGVLVSDDGEKTAWFRDSEGTSWQSGRRTDAPRQAAALDVRRLGDHGALRTP